MSIPIATILTAALTMVQAAPDKLSIDEAVNIAVKNNYGVQITQIAELRTKDQLKQLLSSLGFKLNVQGTYTRYAEKPASFQGASSIDSKTVAATLSQAIDFSPANRLAVKSGKSAVKAATETLNAQINTLKAQVRTAFLTSIRARWQVEIAEETVMSTTERLRVAKLKNDQGVFSNFDLLRFETEATQAKTTLENSKNQFQLTKSNLNNFLQRPVETDFDLSEIRTFFPARTDLKQLTEYAIANRPEYKSVNFRIEQLEFAKRVEDFGLAPSGSIALIHSRNLSPSQFQSAASSFLQFQVNVPILDGGVTKTNIALAKKDVDTAKLQRAQLADSIALQVRQATLNLSSALQQVEFARVGLVSAKEAYRLANVRFQNGLGTVLDVTTSQESLTRARSGFAQAEYDYLTAYAQLQQATGDDAFPAQEGAQPQPIQKP
ncbi:MAG: TolC family protein [Armatimonadetes bacterium]|nr:TolC family protein [Armatimonadota bacterium]